MASNYKQQAPGGYYNKEQRSQNYGNYQQPQGGQNYGNFQQPPPLMSQHAQPPPLMSHQQPPPLMSHQQPPLSTHQHTQPPSLMSQQPPLSTSQPPQPPQPPANQQNEFQYQSSPHEYQQYWSAYWSGYGDQPLMMQQWQKWYDQWNDYYEQQQEQNPSGDNTNTNPPPPPPPIDGASSAQPGNSLAVESHSTSQPGNSHAMESHSAAQPGNSHAMESHSTAQPGNSSGQSTAGHGQQGSGSGFRQRMLQMAGYEREFTRDDPMQPQQSTVNPNEEPYESFEYNNFVSGGVMRNEKHQSSEQTSQRVKVIARLPGNTRGMRDSDLTAGQGQGQGYGSQGHSGQAGSHQGGHGGQASSQRGGRRGGQNRWGDRGGHRPMAPPPLPPGIPINVPLEAKEFPISSGLLHSTKRIRGPNAGLKNPYEEGDGYGRARGGGVGVGGDVKRGGGEGSGGRGGERGGGRGGGGGDRGGGGGRGGDRGGGGGRGGDRGGGGGRGGDRGGGGGRGGNRGGAGGRGGKKTGKDGEVLLGWARRLDSMDIDLNKETEWTTGKELNSVEEMLEKGNTITTVEGDMADVAHDIRFDAAREHIKGGFARKNYSDSLASLAHQTGVRMSFGTLTRTLRHGVYAGQYVCDVYMEGYHLGTGYDLNSKQAKVLACEVAWNRILSTTGADIVKYTSKVDMDELPEMFPDATVSGNIVKGRESNMGVIASKRRPGEFKPLNSFIILVSKGLETNYSMILRQSGDFCAMLIDFDFKRITLPEPAEDGSTVTTNCKVYIEGQLFASENGPERKIAKTIASKVALEKLQKTNYSIIVKREFSEKALDRAFLLEDDDTPTDQPKKKKQHDQSALFTYGKGAALLQKMGWTGGGLGKEGNEGIMEPVSLKDIYGKEGLGFRSDIDVMKEFVPKMEKFLHRYVSENRMETLVITPKLNKAERTELFKISSKLGLKHQSKKCEKHAYILISHKLNCRDLLKYLVSIGGQNNMYELVDPGIKRKAEREKLELEREKQSMDAAKNHRSVNYIQQRYGFPVRQKVVATESKIPPLKVQDEEGKEEDDGRSEDMEVEETAAVDKKQESLSWFLNQFQIDVKKDTNVKERVKKIQEEKVKAKKLYQERLQVEMDEAKTKADAFAPGTSGQSGQYQESQRPLQKQPPGIKVGLHNETEAAREDRLATKNSLALFLQQMRGESEMPMEERRGSEPGSYRRREPQSGTRHQTTRPTPGRRHPQLTPVHRKPDLSYERHDYKGITDDYEEGASDDYREGATDDYWERATNDYKEGATDYWERAPDDYYTERATDDYWERATDDYWERATDDYEEGATDYYEQEPVYGFEKELIEDYQQQISDDYDQEVKDKYYEPYNYHQEYEERNYHQEYEEYNYDQEYERRNYEKEVRNDYKRKGTPTSSGVVQYEHSPEEQGLSTVEEHRRLIEQLQGSMQPAVSPVAAKDSPKAKVKVPVAKPKVDISKETKEAKEERLVAKNSLSFFLQQMQSSGNEEAGSDSGGEDVPEADSKDAEHKKPQREMKEVEEEGVAEAKMRVQESGQQRKGQQDTVPPEVEQEGAQGQSQQKTVLSEVEKGVMWGQSQQKNKQKSAPGQKKPDLSKETEEQRAERLVMKNSLSFLLQQMRGGANDGEEESEDQDEMKDDDLHDTETEVYEPLAKKVCAGSGVLASSEQVDSTSTRARKGTGNTPVKANKPAASKRVT